MSSIEVEELLSAISADAPCGEDLEYDPQFGEMERATEGKPEQQYGDTIIPAEEPDWKEVRRLALALLQRTRDMRVVAHLARAVLHEDGLPAFRDCMTLLVGLVDRYWESVHPQLDPDDNNDPTFRVNTLTSLCADTTLRLLSETPLVSSRGLGRFSQRDIAIASGELPAPADAESVPEMSAIEAAFMDCDVEDLQANVEAASQAIQHVIALEASVTEKVGTANAASLSDLVRELTEVHKILAEQLSRRGVTSDAGQEEVASEDTDGAPPQAAQGLSGEVNSREDVIRALDKICDYYSRHEPSSPLPLLIRRAKRLASMSFLDIIRELTPDALAQAQSIGGIDSEAEEPAS